MASPKPRSDFTIALTVRQLAIAGVAIVLVLLVLLQGRRWRAS